MADSTSRVTITYCTRCNWLLRASWIAGELLQTFALDDIEVTLRPGTGGVFLIEADGPGSAASGGVDADEPRSADGEPGLIWDRKRDGGFPDIVDLKRRVRDVVAPGKPLGHADRAAQQDD